MMKIDRSLLTTACVAIGLVATPAHAQDAAQGDGEGEAREAADEYVDPRVPIVIQARRQERRERQTNYRTRGNGRIADGTTVGQPGSANSAIEPGREAIDWQRVFFERESKKNSPVDRYGHASYMAHCAIKSVGAEAADYVDTDWAGDYERLQEAFRGKHRHCVNSAQRAAPAMMVNAALAEILVTDLVPEPPLHAQAVDGTRAEQFILGDGASQSDFATIGRCLAVFVPGYGYDLLFLEPGSREEKQHLEAMYRAAPECGLEERPSEISPVYQRTAIAMGLFRWYGFSGEAWGGEGG